MYVEIFRKLKDMNDLNWCPDFVMIDYESGMIPALQSEFGGASFLGVFISLQ